MRTIKEFEEQEGKIIGNPYWHDYHEHKFGTMNFLMVTLTKTGRVSRAVGNMPQYRIYQKGEFENYSDKEIVKYFESKKEFTEILDNQEWLIQFNFWR